MSVEVKTKTIMRRKPRMEPKMAYKKPEVVMMPSRRETFSTGGEVKMIFGKMPIALAGYDAQNLSR